MTEMKEKIYPTLPTIRESTSAPNIELTEMGNDQGHAYRLKVISDVQKLTSVTLLVKNIFVLREFLVI